MYNNETIDALAREYVESKNDKVFERLLLDELSNLIDFQLAKHYSSVESSWEDMKQDVFLKLWANRENLAAIRTKKLSQYFYRRIQDWLNRSCNQMKKHDEVIQHVVENIQT